MAERPYCRGCGREFRTGETYHMVEYDDLRGKPVLLDVCQDCAKLDSIRITERKRETHST